MYGRLCGRLHCASSKGAPANKTAGSAAYCRYSRGWPAPCVTVLNIHQVQPKRRDRQPNFRTLSNTTALRSTLSQSYLVMSTHSQSTRVAVKRDRLQSDRSHTFAQSARARRRTGWRARVSVCRCGRHVEGGQDFATRSLAGHAAETSPTRQNERSAHPIEKR